MRYCIGTAALTAGLLIALAGCSDHANPVATQETALALAEAGGDPVAFAARVETTNQIRRMLTFAGVPDTVIAEQHCEIVRLKGNEEAPAGFAGIKPWDSVGVYGNRQQDGYVYAYRLEICLRSCYDVAVRDTIATIDYAAQTFTVAGLPQTIQVDENTLIWGNIVMRRASHRDRYAHQYALAEPAAESPGYQAYRRDTTLLFADLKVGDVIELRAVTVDENTLLAAAIKLTNCGDALKRCISFEATIATLDVDARAVTFDGLIWNGVVCNGARLLAADDTPITLADFAVGELVAVKGHEEEADVLKICYMQKL